VLQHRAALVNDLYTIPSPPHVIAAEEPWFVGQPSS